MKFKFHKIFKLFSFFVQHTLYFRAVLLIVVFIVITNAVAWQTGAIDQLSKIFYWPPEEGAVAGEFSSIHPHFVAKSEDFKRIKQYIADGKEPWKRQYDYLISQARGIPAWDPSSIADLGAGYDFKLNYKDFCDKDSGRIAKLSLAAVLSDDGGIIQKAKDYVLGWANESKLQSIDQKFTAWNHTHAYDSIVINIGLAYDWLYDNFTSSERAQIESWNKKAIEFIKPRHEASMYLSNQKAWDDAALMIAGLIIKDTEGDDSLIKYVVNGHNLSIFNLIDGMLGDDGRNISEYYHGATEIWHTFLTRNAMTLVAAAAFENGYMDLFKAHGGKLSKSFSFYADLYKNNDLSTFEGGVYHDAPDWLYYSGIYEIANKYIQDNPDIKNVLAHSGFNNGNGRYCDNSRDYCSRWTRYPNLIWGYELNEIPVLSENRTLIPDFNCDNKVDIQDFGIMLSHWEQTSGFEVACHASKKIDIMFDDPDTKEIEGDGIINYQDIAKLLSCWGVPSSEYCWLGSEILSYTPLAENNCGNGIIDTGEVCDPGPPDVGVPANGLCQYNCQDWSCEYGYKKDGESCILVQPSITGTCQANQYSDQTIIPVAYDSLARPNLGESYDDPSFCTTVTRISDSENAYVVNSEPMYFNSDDSYFMSRDNNINYLYSASSGQRVMKIGGGDFRPFAVRWSRIEPMVFYQVTSSGINRCVVNVSSSDVSCSQYSGIGGLGTGGDPVGEGDLSYDGRYWLLDQGGELVVFDFQTRNISSRSGLSISDGVDYGVISPSGKYALVAWGTDQSAAHYGIELYDASSWNMLKRMHVIPVHFEVGLDDQGNEMMFSMAGNTLDDLEYLKSTHNISDLGMWNIFGAYLQYNGGKVLLKNSTAVHHTSAFPDGQKDYIYFALEEKNPNGASKPDPDKLWGPYWGEILQIPTDGSGLVKRLVHHRTHKTKAATSHKAYQPDFIVSNDGKTIVFNSTFGVKDSKCDLYMLKTDQIVGGGGATTARKVFVFQKEDDKNL